MADGERELNFNVLNYLLLNPKDILSQEKYKLAEAIRTHLTDETLIKEPSALLSLSMHSDSAIAEIYQEKITLFSGVNQAFSLKLLP